MPIKQRGRTDAIDWEEIHQRLREAAAATEGALCLSSEQSKLVMDKRARALAQVSVQLPSSTDVLQVVTFSLANERYGIETRYVQAIIRGTDCTPIPGAPDFLVGVLNLRGEILPIFDLRKFFNVADNTPSELCQILVLGNERSEFGIVADVVRSLAMLRADEVLEPPDTLPSMGRELLRGVTGDVLILLDGPALLQDSRFFVDQSEEVGG